MQIPDSIERDVIKAFAKTCGLTPHEARSITIRPSKVIVTAYVLDENGHKQADNATGDIVTRTFEIPVVS